MKPEGATAFWGWTDAEVRAEMARHFDKHGHRLPEVDEEVMERLIRGDCEINTILYSQWKENVAGLKRLGIDTTSYEHSGPVTYGNVPGEYRRAATVSRPLMHDAQPPPGHRRLCGQILAVK